jgi:hypothetical protein
LKTFQVLIYCLVILISIKGSSAAEKQVVIDSVFVEQNDLCITFHVDGLFDPKTIQGLERGFIAEIIYKVQLWQERLIFSNQLQERVASIKVYYDNWEEKFAIVSENQNRLTAHMETVLDLCTVMQALPIIEKNELDFGKSYFLTIKAILQPISDESLKDLQDWLAGRPQPRQGEREEQSGKDNIFDFVVGLMGFGDRELNLKSDSFFLAEQQIVFQK